MSAIKINGTWQRVSSIKIKQDGVWSDHTALYARLDGAWHLIDLTAEAQGPAYHVWKAYADDALGNGISLSPEGKEYIGFAVGQRTEEPDLSDPSLYDWSLIKGADGKDGQDVDPEVLDEILEKQNSYNSSLSDVNDGLSAVEQALADADSRLKAADTALNQALQAAQVDFSNSVDSLNQSIGDLDTTLSGQVQDLDATLSGKVQDLDGSLSKQIQDLDASTAGHVSRIDTKLNGVDSSLTSITTSMNSEFDRVDSSLAAASGRIGEVENDLLNLTSLSGEQGSSITQLENATDEQAQKISVLETNDGSTRARVASLESTSGEQATRLSSLGVWDGEAFATIKTLEEADAENASLIRTLETRGEEADSKIATLESTSSSHSSRLTNVETKATDTQNRVATVEETTLAHATRLTNVETKADDTESKVSTLEETSEGHASRLTNVETKATTGVNKANAAQASADAANSGVGEVTNRVSTLEETSEGHASRLTNVETKATTGVNKANAAQASADAANSGVGEVTNRVSTLEETSEGHASRLTNVETKATTGVNKANAAQASADTANEGVGEVTNRVSTLEETSEGHASRLTNVETKATTGVNKANAAQASADTANEGVGEVTNRVSTLEETSEGHASRLTNVETKATTGVNKANAAQASADAANSGVSEVTNRVSTLEETSEGHASRLTNVETKATTGVNKANAAQASADTANEAVGEVTNRVSTLEETSEGHASRLTNVETKATTGINKANAAQASADAANSGVGEVTNRVSTLEETSEGHASRLTNVETKATSAVDKANTNSNRVSSLESTSSDHATRLASVESVNLEQLAGAKVQSSLTPNVGWPTETTIEEAVTFKLSCSYAGKAALRVKLDDAEWYTQIAFNGEQLSPKPTGADRELRWYEYLVDALEGDNEVAVWATSTDGGRVVAIELRGGDLGSSVKTLESTSAGHASRLTNVETKATTAVSKADAAQNTANSGVSKANAAQSTADAANTKVTAVTNRVSTLEETSEGHASRLTNVETKATTGVNKANAAQASADEANESVSEVTNRVSTLEETSEGHASRLTNVETKATTGVNKANAAQSTADSGVAKANAAQASADEANESVSEVTNRVSTLEETSEGHASRLTNVETKATSAVTKADNAQSTANSGVSKADAAQSTANSANTKVTAVTNRVTSLEETSEGHASRLTNVETKATTAVNKADAAQDSADSANTKVSSVTNRVGSLEETSEGHASRLTNVETKASNAESKANTNSNRVSSLESTSNSHATRLTNVESVNLEQLSGSRIQSALSPNIGWTGNSSYEGANKFTLACGYAGKAALRLKLWDAEGGLHVAFNGTEVSPRPKGSNEQTKWFEYLVDAQQGDNEVAFWSSSDGGKILRIELRGGDLGSSVQTLESTSTGHASRLTNVETKATTAVSKADAAQSTADSGVSKANAAQSTANSGVSKANAAQTAADNAQETADSANTKVTAVTNRVSTLEDTSEGHASRLTNVETKATSAVTKADNAQSTANSGVSKANAAQSSANEANSKITTVTNRVSVLEESSEGHASRLTNVETKATTGVNKANAAQASADDANTKVSSVSTRVSVLETSDTDKATRLSELEFKALTEGSDEISEFASMGAMAPRYVMGFIGTIRYGAFENETVIYVNGRAAVEADKGDTGTLSGLSEGDKVESNKPVALVGVSGEVLPPAQFASTQLLAVSRSGSSTGERRQRANLLSVYGDAEVELTYKDGSPAVDTISGSSSIKLDSGAVKTIEVDRPSGTEYFFIKATRPILAVGTNGVGADSVAFKAPSREYITGSQGVRVIKTGDAQVHNNGSGYYYSDDPFYLYDYGDGAGTDAETGVPRKMAGDTYLLPHTVYDFSIISAEPCSVKVYHLDGNLHGTYDITAAKGGRVNVGAHSGAASSGVLAPNGMFFVGSAPFAVRTNISEGEYHAVGYKSSLRPAFEAQAVSNVSLSRVSTLETTASDHSSRLSEVETKSERNESRVGVLEVAKEGHASRLTSVETKANSGVSKAEAAQSTADSATTKANNAQSTANSATTKANNAQNAADQANEKITAVTNRVSTLEETSEGHASRLSTVETTATSGVNKANAAQSTANSATTKANNAQSTANSATTKANNAQSAADDAQESADAANSKVNAVTNRVSTLEETSEGHASRLSSVETKATSGVNKADAAQAKANSADSKVNAVTSRVTSLENTSATHATKIDEVSLSRSNIVTRGVFGADLSRGGWTAGSVVSTQAVGIPTLSGRPYVLKLTTRDCYDYNAQFPISVGDKIYISAWVYTTDTDISFNLGLRMMINGQEQSKWPLTARITDRSGKWVYVEGTYTHTFEAYNGATPFLQMGGSGTMPPAYISDIVYSRSSHSGALAKVTDESRAYVDQQTGELKAERVIKADANGKVSGVHLLANGSGAEAGGKLYFQADEIAIVPPNWNGSSELDKSKFPFYFSEDRNYMYLDEATIQRLSAETIDSGSLAVDGLTLLSDNLSLPAGAVREHMIDPAFKDGIVRVNPDAEILGGTKSVSSTGIGQGKKITVPVLKSGGSAQKMTITVVGPNVANSKDVRFDLEMKVNGAPYNFSSGQSKIRLESTITYSEEDEGFRIYRTSFNFEDTVILPAPTKGNEYTYEFTITNMTFNPANTSTFNYAGKLQFSISVSEPTVSSGGFITDVRWSEVKEQPSFVALDTSGNSSYPRMVAGNNPASSNIWLRVPSTSGGLLPYSNGNSLLGTSSWKFKEIHSVNFYENGTALSSKYLGKTATAANAAKLDNLDSTQFLRNDQGGTIQGPLSIRHTNVQLNLIDSTYSDHYWQFDHQNGVLGFRYNGGDIVFQLHRDGDATFNHNVSAPSITEGGTALSSKYLGKTATATNASKLGGRGYAEGANANSIASRNSNGDIYARLFRSTYGNQNTIGGAIAFRNSTTDNYIRFCSDMGAVRNFIGVYSKSEGDNRYVRTQRGRLTDLDTALSAGGTYHWSSDAVNSPYDWGTLLSLVSTGGDYNGSNNWLTHLAFATSGKIFTRRKINSAGFTSWSEVVQKDDADVYYAAKSHGHTGLGSNAWGGIRSINQYGYIDFGPANESHAHIYTDRPDFYFNKELEVNGKRVWHAGNTGDVAKKSVANTFTTGQEIDATGTVLTLGGSSKQDGSDVSVYIGNSPSAYGFYLTYQGSKSGNDNSLLIRSTNNGSPQNALLIKQDASTYLYGKTTVAGGGLVVSNNGKTIGSNPSNSVRGWLFVGDGTSGVGIDNNEIACSNNLIISSPNISVNGATSFVDPVNARGGLKQGSHTILNGSDTWIRTHGTDGIYFSTYGGGIRMEDSTWVRTYNGKAFFSSSTNTLQSINTDGGIRFKHQLYSSNPTGEGGIVGNYKTLGYSVDQMIWTIGTDWRTHSTHYGLAYHYGSEIFGSSNRHQIVLKQNGVTNVRLAMDGNAKFYATVRAVDFVATSDRRVKDNIKVIPNALHKVGKLTGNTYTRSDMEGAKSAGVIAQEVQEVLPEAVTETEGKLQVAHNGVIGLLVEAVKELTAKVKQLEAQVG